MVEQRYRDTISNSTADFKSTEDNTKVQRRQCWLEQSLLLNRWEQWLERSAGWQRTELSKNNNWDLTGWAVTLEPLGVRKSGTVADLNSRSSYTERGVSLLKNEMQVLCWVGAQGENPEAAPTQQHTLFGSEAVQGQGVTHPHTGGESRKSSNTTVQ